MEFLLMVLSVLSSFFDVLSNLFDAITAYLELKALREKREVDDHPDPRKFHNRPKHLKG